MNSVSIGKRLKSIRERREFSQEDAANKAGITTRTLSRIETGVVSPSFETILALVALYKVSLDDLIVNEKKSEKNFKTPSLKFAEELLHTLEGLPPARKQFVFALIFDDERYLELPDARLLMKAAKKST